MDLNILRLSTTHGQNNIHKKCGILKSNKDTIGIKLQDTRGDMRKIQNKVCMFKHLTNQLVFNVIIMIPTFKRTGFKYVTCHCKSLHLLSDSIVCQTDFLLIVFYIVNNHVKITLKVYSNFFSKTSFLNHFNSFHGKLNLSFINDQIVLFMCQTFICMYFD